MSRRLPWLSLPVLVSLIALAPASPASAQADPHAGHHPAAPAPAAPAQAPAEQPAAKPSQLPPFIPPITDEDRRAAFPDVRGHAVHDRAVGYFVLFDQLEWHGGWGANGIDIDTRGWVGRDRGRLWFRAEGDKEAGRFGEAQAHVLYGRQFARWWDVVAGVRHDFHPGSARTWAAIGIQGLAPLWFEVAATAYVGPSGPSHARLEIEYELLLTNRLVLQPLLEAEIVGKSDPERLVGAGLSTTDAGLRLRYEIRREVAPYVGLTWRSKWGRTAEISRAAGEGPGGARFVSGVRLWF